ncbi:MAG: SDR family oxidoreductase [Phycisphaeraceae bacterium]|nr:SDR family oxidoreductase [Phycisphaeraceae bacterium]MBX3405897.1 SDR family oxidoreductase [Phycisphaeraceae bacterium]
MAEQVALITGGGSGIGRALARTLVAEGWSVAITGRRVEALRETASLTADPNRVLVLASDVSDPAAAAEVVKATVERFSRLDALINNAGGAPLAPIDKTTPAMLQECFAVNALGPGYLIATAWPEFKRQADAARTLGGPPRATVVNVSSMATKDPFAGFFAYAAAKAAVNLMAQSCAKEGRAIGIRAFAVAPGAVETPMLRANFNEKMIPPARALDPAAVADTIAACLRGERDADNGQVIWVPSP